jgi:UPF0271 protein
MKSIDLNCDMGELPEHVTGGTQELLMPHLTSVNIACGGHAGDEQTMHATIEQALRFDVAIGAHPGYADRVHFGREPLRLSPSEIADSVFDQVRALDEVAAACGATVKHVKPHGALYNQAASDRAIARAVADGVARWKKNFVLVGLAGSLMLDVFRDAGFVAAAEAFADRRYEPDGSLRSRKFADALILDPAEAAAQAVRIVQNGSAVAVSGDEISIHAQTLCIHGDTPGAPKIAAAVAAALRSAGIRLAPLRQ